MNLFIIAAVILTGLALVMVIRPLLRTTENGPAAPVAAIVLGLAFPAAVLIVYLAVSNHDWSASPVPAGRGSNVEATDINAMTAQLEERLRAEPDNVEGWLMLGRTYAQLEQISDSRRAYRQAMALDASSEAKLGVAEADIMLDRANLLRDAGRLVEEVLAAEPDNPKALFYGGMVSMAKQDIDTFRDRWQRLLTMSPPDQIRQVIESELAKVAHTIENSDADSPSGNSGAD